MASGDGEWRWVPGEPARLAQVAAAQEARALDPAASGARGTWSCRAKTSAQGGSVGLLFQVSRDLREGFALVVGPDGARLQDMGGRVLWETASVTAEPGREYILQGVVTTDRISVAVLGADGAELTRSPDVYVPDTNNNRRGHPGVTARGPGEFWGFGVEPE